MFKKDDVGFAPEQLPPPGVKRPMCWCGDKCCFQISDDWDSYGQRYWMCRNYSYSLEKPKPVPKGRKGKAKIPVKEPEIPPPLCDFVEWIDNEMTEFDKSMIQSWRERQEEREERQRQRAAKEKAERERREELELRELARLNRERKSVLKIDQESWLGHSVRRMPGRKRQGRASTHDAPSSTSLESSMRCNVRV
uniref:Zinc finger GRF-type domain-containing protein n=1 Tax=Oryza punctata TaxID=4537 RepID=A0A0E0L4A1_ORYPU